MAKTRLDMTEGSIPKKLLRFVIPLIITNIVQQLYSSADNAVVGQFSGKECLAAVGATTASTALILHLVTGLALGNSIVNSNLLGKRDIVGLRKAMHTSIIVSLISGVFIGIVGLIITPLMMHITNCPESVFDSAVLYMRIIFCGAPATLIYNFGSGIMRTYGDSKRPMYIIMATGLLNVILNLVFVVFFKMTVDGVALATIISKYISAAAVLLILFSPKNEYKLRFKELRLHKKEAFEIIRVGLPCGLNSIVFSISNTVVQSGVNNYGDIVVAGSTACNNITNLLYQVILSFYSGCVTFAGQNYGAGKLKRIDRLLLWSMGITALFIAASAAIITLRPSLFISIFNRDPDVIAAGSQKLLIVSWSYVLFAITDMFMGCLRGMKQSSGPSIINVFCVCLIRVAWVTCVAPLFPGNLILLYACYPISYIFSTATLLVYYLIFRKKAARKLQEA